MTGKRRIAEIAGAGPAGLTAATALAQRGWEVHVHERSRELREIGAELYLYENALNALRSIGVYDKVAASGVEMTVPRDLRDHNNNPIIIRRDGVALPELVVILRTELHKILTDCAVASGAEINTSSQVLGADNGGRFEFASGFGAQADLVVGADGVFSRVRDSLHLTKEIIELRDGCGRHLVSRLEADSVNAVRVEVWNGGRRVGIAPASRDHHNIFLCCPENDIQGRMQQPFNLDAWVDSHPWYREYLERLPRHPEEYWRPFYNVKCTAWANGKVAIVGDAAHAMAPNLGQGACVPLCNAVVLARAVTATDDVPQALREWQASERPYIDITQRNSYLYGAIGTRWPRRLLALRSRILPVIGRADRVQRSLRSAIDHVSSI